MKQNKQRVANDKTRMGDDVREPDATNQQDIQENAADNAGETDKVAEECQTLQKKYDELNDSHLRLMAEYDNYRKRTLREKAELIKNGGESTIVKLLPVVDDFERAIKNIDNAEDIKAVAEGVDLIYNKFITTLSQLGVKPINPTGKEFDTEESEAVAIIPAPAPDLKGKVIDCVQTGYSLNDKVIRHAKVVVGE